MDKKLQNKLDKRREEGILRSLSSFEGFIDFLSNDYLGCSQLQLNDKAVREGSTGSRLISGNRARIEESEEKLASFFQFQSGLFFNSGYDANLGIFSSIPQKGDVVLYDEHIHASVRDGLRLSLANSYSFKHNNVSDLERLLAKFNDKTIYVVVEGIYSMHGDLAPIKQIYTLLKKYPARLIIDEAHSAGVIGENGRGVVEGSDDPVYIKLVTFGKAYGAHGAIVLTDDVTRDFLINFARSFIYTTALPIESYISAEQLVTYGQLYEERERLRKNILSFRSKLHNVQLISDEHSPIQVVRMGSVERLRELADRLVSIGIAAKVMYPPTVPCGEESLRICLHAFNTEEEINQLAATISG